MRRGAGHVPLVVHDAEIHGRVRHFGQRRELALDLRRRGQESPL